MKTLFLLRHAKSSWNEPVDDHDRPLAPRGRRAAPAMAEYMAAERLIPDAVLCSTATRTRETWSRMERALGQPPMELKEEIYEASASDLFEVVRNAGDGADRLLLIGHNPGMQRLALSLAGSGDGDARRRLHHKFPTAALAVLTFDAATWVEVGEGDGRLTHLVRPKDLPDADERRL